MIPTVDEVLTALTFICPNFKTHWEEAKYWTWDDGTVTYCGLFFAFTDFVRANFSQMPPQKQQALMDFIELCLIADGEDDNDLDTSACTCFLENLSGEPPLSEQLRIYMGPKSLAFFNQWDYPQCT